MNFSGLRVTHSHSLCSDKGRTLEMNLSFSKFIAAVILQLPVEDISQF